MDDLFPSAVWLEVRSLIRISGAFSLELMRCFCAPAPERQEVQPKGAAKPKPKAKEQLKDSAGRGGGKGVGVGMLRRFCFSLKKKKKTCFFCVVRVFFFWRLFFCAFGVRFGLGAVGDCFRSPPRRLRRLRRALPQLHDRRRHDDHPERRQRRGRGQLDGDVGLDPVLSLVSELEWYPLG